MKNFNTLVIQPHRSPLPFPWTEHCLESVRQWYTLAQYAYQFFSDELFADITAHLLKKTLHQRIIATDPCTPL